MTIFHRYYQTSIVVWCKCRWKRPSDSPFGMQNHQWSGPRHRLQERVQNDLVPTADCSTCPCSTSCTAGDSSNGRSETLCRPQRHIFQVICSIVLIICDSAVCVRRTGRWSWGTLSSGTLPQTELGLRTRAGTGGRYMIELRMTGVIGIAGGEMKQLLRSNLDHRVNRRYFWACIAMLYE